MALQRNRRDAQGSKDILAWRDDVRFYNTCAYGRALGYVRIPASINSSTHSDTYIMGGDTYSPYNHIRSPLYERTDKGIP